MRRLFRLFIAVAVVFSFMGCSSQYSLERKIYQLNLKVSQTLPRIKEMPETEVTLLLNEIDKVLAQAKERKMEMPLIKLKIAIYGMRGNYEMVKNILSNYKSNVQIGLLNGLYRIGLRWKDSHLCFWSLNRVKPLLKHSRAIYSLPYLRCIAELRCGEEGTKKCEQAIGYYQDLIKASQAKIRFYGYRGLFLCYVNLGKRKEALKVLDDMVKDKDLPLGVLFNGLRQEVFILWQTKEYDKIINLLEDFIDAYGKKLKPEVKKKLKKLISELKKKKKV